MTTTPEAVMRSYIDAVQRGDWAAGVAHMSEEVVLNVPGRSPLAGPRRGRVAALDYIRGVLAHADAVDFGLVDMMVGGRHVALMVNERIACPDGTLDLRRTNVYRVEDGAIVEVSIFEGDQYAVDEHLRDPMDVTRILLKQLIDMFFGAVSFPIGARPAYDRLPDLFVDGAMLIDNRSNRAEMMTVDEFVTSCMARVDAGELTSFRERELTHLSETFGDIAHRFSTYEKHGTTNDGGIAAKGAISTQFIRTPRGWKISSMAWDDERPGVLLPAR